MVASSDARQAYLHTPEFSLAVTACMWPHSEKRAAGMEKCLERPIDWQLFLRVVERHRITGLVNHALTRTESGCVPADVRSALKDRADALARQSLQTAAEASRLVSLFEKAGIPCVVLKGAPLAMLAYQNLGLRHSRDNDLLVSPYDFDAAEGVLMSCGYERVKPGKLASEERVEMHRRHCNGFEFIHEPKGLAAELHYRLHNNSAFGQSIDIRKEQPKWQSVDLGEGLQVSTLRDSDLLAYLCAHGSRHSWFRLKWLADVGALLAKDPDAASGLLEVSRSQGTSRSAMQALLLCHYFWGIPLPEQMPAVGWAVRKLAGAAYSAMITGSAATEPHNQRIGTTRMSMNQYLLSSNLVYLWQEAYWHLFFPIDLDQLPNRLHFFYPILRFLLWLTRKLANQSPAQAISTGVRIKEAAGTYMYQVSGLVVRSEVKLTSAIAIAGEPQSPDVVIQAGSIPAHLESPLRSAEAWEAANWIFLLRIPGIGRFLIRDGREVIFDLDPACEARTLGLYLLGTCFAILLQQRGNIVLHASAVASDGRAMLFCGSSGAGKSTMAALLCQRGYSLLNDDACNLIPAANDTYEVRPDGRMLKLWDQSLERLAWSKQANMQVQADMEKYFIAPPVSEVEAQPVGAIYILREAQEGEENSIRRLRALDAMIELKRNAYRPFLVSAMDMESVYFHASAALQRGAGIYLLSRRKDFGDSDSLLNLLKEHWKSLFSSPSPFTMELSNGPDDGRHYLSP